MPTPSEMMAKLNKMREAGDEKYRKEEQRQAAWEAERRKPPKPVELQSKPEAQHDRVIPLEGKKPGIGYNIDEKVASKRRKFLPTKLLNNNSKHWPMAPAEMDTKLSQKVADGIEKASFVFHPRDYDIDMAPVNCVAVDVTHGKDSPYSRCAIISVEHYFACFKSGMNMQWRCEGAYESVTSRIRHIDRHEGGEPVWKYAAITVARFLFKPEKERLLSFSVSPFLLLLHNFTEVPARSSVSKGQRRMKSERLMVREHVAHLQQQKRTVLRSPLRYLIPPEEVDQKIQAFLTDFDELIPYTPLKRNHRRGRPRLPRHHDRAHK